MKKDYKQELANLWDLQEHALDFIETYNNEEIAQLVREGVLTMEDVEAGLRRAMEERG